MITARGATCRSSCWSAGESASGSLVTCGDQWTNPCTATGRTKRAAATAASPCRSRTARRRKNSAPSTSAAAPAGCEAGERDERERGDGDRAAAARECGLDPEAVRGPDLQLERVLLQ